MIPIDMTIMHDPENGKFGDCLRCAIASILELPAESVPHFAEGGRSGKEFKSRVIKYLSSIGYMELWITPTKWVWPDCFHLMNGKTNRGIYHTVVGFNGEVVHDPHPSREGLLDDDDLVWSFLVATNLGNLNKGK